MVAAGAEGYAVPVAWHFTSTGRGAGTQVPLPQAALSAAHSPSSCRLVPQVPASAPTATVASDSEEGVVASRVTVSLQVPSFTQ